ncbi:hypothetical protein IKT18_02070 [Candidatus Saccharibacteria bacterium]|nr:hypothetical protein [Candidatus Saccharibacteria bacterium]
MDNRVQPKTPGETPDIGAPMPENWMPEPQHDQSKMGGEAINATIASNPDSEETPLMPPEEEAFEITEAPTSAPAKTDEQEPKLVFDPTDIAPKKEGIDETAKKAVGEIEDLFKEGNAKAGLDNYQALRAAVNGGESK